LKIPKGYLKVILRRRTQWLEKMTKLQTKHHKVANNKEKPQKTKGCATYLYRISK
jgi:hypothetical protein